MKRYRVTVDGQVFDVIVEEAAAPGTDKAAAPEPLAARASPEPRVPPTSDGALVVDAPMPGLIVGIPVKRGDRVEAGDVLLILEAMKMENEITAPERGLVREIHVSVGDTVGSGEILMELNRPLS